MAGVGDTEDCDVGLGDEVVVRLGVVFGDPSGGRNLLGQRGAAGAATAGTTVKRRTAESSFIANVPRMRLRSW